MKKDIPPRICPLCHQPIVGDNFKEVDGPVGVVHESCYKMMEENQESRYGDEYE